MFKIKILLFFSFIFLLSCTGEKEKENDLLKSDLSGNVYQCVELFYQIGGYKDGSAGQKLDFSSICTYDRNGYLIQYQQFDSENKETTKYVYKIDENGNTIEKRFFRPDGSPGFKIFYKYDRNNNKIEELLYDSSNILEEKYVHKYNGENKIIRSDVTKRDTNRNESYTWIYNSNGNIIRENYYYGIDLEDYKGLNLDHYIIYKYDSSNNIIEEKYKEDKTYFREERSWSQSVKYDENIKSLKEFSLIRMGILKKN